MSEMVERLKLALREALGEADIFKPDFGDYGRVIVDGALDMERLARAAIEAMREPTWDMKRAVKAEPDSGARVDFIFDSTEDEEDFYAMKRAVREWSAMIDAALK